MSFEEQFPELKNKVEFIADGLFSTECQHFGKKYDEFYVLRDDVEKFCLSKQRVKEAYKKASQSGLYEGNGFDDELFLKELGLEKKQ